MLSDKWKLLLCYLIVNQGTAYLADVNIKATQPTFLALYSNLSATVNLSIYRLAYIKLFGKLKKTQQDIMIKGSRKHFAGGASQWVQGRVLVGVQAKPPEAPGIWSLKHGMDML